MKPGEVQLSLKFWMRKNGLQFGTEVQLVIAEVKIQGLDSEPVARQNQPPGILRPNRDGKHAAQAREAVLIPSQKRAQDYFGVTVGFESFAARFQFRAQFAVIVDLAVENQDSISVLADHGLIAGLKIDDFEAHGPQRDTIRFVGALLIRASVSQRVRSRPNPRAVEHTVTVRKPGYAAQMPVSPSRRKSPGFAGYFLLSDLLANKNRAAVMGCFDLALGGAMLKKECTLRSITLRLI